MFRNVSLIHHCGFARRHFWKLPWPFTSVLVVADEMNEQDPIQSDSTGLSTLLLVRDIQMWNKNLFDDGIDESDYITLAKECPILVEILDARTEESVKQSRSLNLLAEFVQSNEMVSRVLAMVSQEAAVNYILNEILGGAGCSMEVQSGDRYTHPNERLSFMQLSMRVHDVDELLVGYQEDNEGIVETFINPRDKDVVKEWNDKPLIVLRGLPMHPTLHNGT